MRRLIYALFIIILISSCSPSLESEDGTSSVTVMIEDSIASRSSILPVVDGSNISNTDIEFYKIWLYSGTSETEAESNASTDVDPETSNTADGCSGYQPRENASYTLSNIESGLYWVARVWAYADTSPADGSSSGLVMVAEAVSNAQAVFGNDDSISVSLNELGTSDSSIGQVEKAGKIAITLKLPNGSDGASITCNAIPLSGTAAGEISVPVSDTVTLSAENTFTFTISENTFEQGNYLLTVSIEKKNADDTVYLARSGSVLMKLLPGLSASGTIDLDYDVSLSPGLGIEDNLGSSFTITTEGVRVYEYTDSYFPSRADGKKNDIIFSYKVNSSFLSEKFITVVSYLDGEYYRTTMTTGTSLESTISDYNLEPGEHTLVLIATAKENYSSSDNIPAALGYYSETFEIEYTSDDITIESESV